MADEQVVFTGDASTLNDAQIKELQQKFGLKLSVRSTRDAISAALGRIGDAAVQNFDRVNPSYGRVFDRTGDSVGDLKNQVINPVELEAHVREVAERVLRERPKQRGGG
jgi:hypothetical protein